MHKLEIDDFITEAAMGLIPGVFVHNQFGVNDAVGTTDETIWSQGAIYAYLAAASVLKVSSASANDASAGTGARTVTLYGLDANYGLISETVILNGQTAVNSVNSYLRIYRMTVRTAGSGGKNEGIVYAGTGTVTAGVPAVTYCAVPIGLNKSMMTPYTIPAGYTGYLYDGDVTSDTQKATTYSLYMRPFGEVFQISDELSNYQGPVSMRYAFPIPLTEKTDIELRARVDAGTARLSGHYHMLVIAND